MSVDADRLRLAGLAADAHGTNAADAAVSSCPLLLDWIRIELVGEDGIGVADVEYELTLPDQTLRRGKLDAQGTAHIRDIPPGTCSVSFPTLDADTWEPLAGTP